MLYALLLIMLSVWLLYVHVETLVSLSRNKEGLAGQIMH